MPPSAASRDRALRRVRLAAWGVGVGAAALTGGLSVVAAHAFKGHNGKARVTTAVARSTRAVTHVKVPPPERVPAIAGQPAPLQPPAQPPAQQSAQPPTQQPPAAVPQEQAPAPPVSGGS
jgi:hypothetical protein